MERVILDGGMGTQVQAEGLAPGARPELFGMEHPDRIAAIHKRYIDAGSTVIYANTFGANRRKLKGTGYSAPDVIRSNIAAAKEAAAGTDVRVALDIGPIGELVEPLGLLTFEEAYDTFSEMVEAGAEAGADLIVIETMTDLYETKAAVLAAKEHADLPIWVTMTFEANGRTFLGVSVSSAVLALTALGVSAVGINCSLGPAELVPLVKEMLEWTDLPIIVKPNAGLPDPQTGAYALTPESFAEAMTPFVSLGVSFFGGCCGTTPDFIRSLKEMVQRSSEPAPDLSARRRRNGVCSPGHIAEYGKLNVIGERINPTEDPALQKALRDHDLAYVEKLAIEQQEAGAAILDINVGMQGIDEVRLMTDVVKAVQSVVDLPLAIDSADPAVMEAGLRAVNGRPFINSVNGEEDRMNAYFPLAAHYGAALIGLCMDEDGIPETADERIMIATRMLERCLRHNLNEEDLVIDCVALTVCAQQDQTFETLKAIGRIRSEFGLHCALGVSNISFGLPARAHVTENFLIQALGYGLEFPIVNPNEPLIADAVTSFRVLSGEDTACRAYIERFAAEEPVSHTGTSGSAKNTLAETSSDPLANAILQGYREEAEAQTRLLLGTESGMDLINQTIIPALDRVGRLYETGSYFLPQLINAANAATCALNLIKKTFPDENASSAKGTIVLATVRGDIHDIGKNIVKVLLENYGYRVIDLGRDVEAAAIVDTAVREKASLLGLSALMTTTVGAMKETIEALRASGCPCKTMVGGAVLTQEYADEIGADFYAKDAQASVGIAQKVLG